MFLKTWWHAHTIFSGTQGFKERFMFSLQFFSSGGCICLILDFEPFAKLMRGELTGFTVPYFFWIRSRNYNQHGATVPYTLYPLYLCSTKYFRVAPKPIAFPCTPWLLQVPAASVSGNSKAEKEAFKGAWRSARQLLCHFHILQAEWRWPTAANIQVMQDQRCPIKAAFQKVLTQYAI